MSTKTEKAETTEEKAPAKEAPAPKGSSDVAKHSKERLLEDAYQLTGYPSYVLAGALADSSGELTVDQAVAAAEKFLNSEVKEG